MERKELVEILGMSKEALSTQDIIPIYSYFAFTGTSVVSYDDMVAVELPFDFDKKCCLPGVPLFRYLEALSCESITVEEVDEESVVVKGGRSKVAFKYLPLSDFTFKLPVFKEEHVTIKADEDFFTGLALCDISVSSDPTFPYSTGILLYEDRDEGLQLFSTNMRSLSRYNLSTERQGKKPLKGYTIFPSKFCKIIHKLNEFFVADKLTISRDRAMLLFSNGAKVFTKLLDPTDTPDFKATFDERTETNSAELVSIPKNTSALLDRADVVFGPSVTEKRLSFVFDQKGILISANSTFGEFKERLVIKGMLNDIDSCSVSLELFKKGAASCGHFTFLEDNMMMVNGEDEEFTYLVSYFEEEED